MKKALFFWLCLFCYAAAQAQLVTPQTFNAYFDIGEGQSRHRPKHTVGRQIIPDSTGIYYFGNIVGTDSIAANVYQLNGSIGVAKYDYTGSLLWKKWYRSPGFLNYINSKSPAIVTKDGFTILGIDADTTFRDSAWVDQPFLFFINKSGDSLRLVKHLDSLHDRTLLCATGMPDQSILAAGVWGSADRTYSLSQRRYLANSHKLYLVKYDSIGNILWEKTYFPTANLPVNPFKIARAADGGILICGLASTGIVPSFGHFFAKFDSSGNFLWSRRYPYNSTVYSYLSMDIPDLLPLDDGGYYFTYMANTKPPSGDPYNYNAVYAYGRANAQGDTMWLKTYAEWISSPTDSGDRYSAPASLFVDQHKNLFIQGHQLDTNFVPMLLITDSNGRIKSKRTYDLYRGYGNPYMGGTVRSPYNTLVHFGSMEFKTLVPGLIDTVGTYGWIMQTDSFGCMQPGCEIADTVWHYNPTAVATTEAYEQVVLYPNPASHRVVLEGVPPGSRYDIIDMKGTCAGSGTVAQSRTEINVEAFVPGVYIIRVLVGDKPPVQIRLVKQ